MATVSSCRYQHQLMLTRVSSCLTVFVPHVQVSEDAASLAEDGLSGRSSQLSAALVELMQRYLSQFQLLAEIQGLRSR